MKKYNEEEIKAILLEKRSTGKTLEQTAAKYEVGVSTISAWQKKFGVNGKKAPKRRVKRAVKADDAWEALFNEYIQARNEANDYILQAKKSTAKMETARKKLEAFVKGLK